MCWQTLYDQRHPQIKICWPDTNIYSADRKRSLFPQIGLKLIDIVRQLTILIASINLKISVGQSHLMSQCTVDNVPRRCDDPFNVEKNLFTSTGYSALKRLQTTMWLSMTPFQDPHLVNFELASTPRAIRSSLHPTKTIEKLLGCTHRSLMCLS